MSTSICLICPTCGEKMGEDGDHFTDCPHCGYGVQMPVARILGLALLLGQEPLPTVGVPVESVAFARRAEVVAIEMSKMLQKLNPDLIEQSAKDQMRLFGDPNAHG